MSSEPCEPRTRTLLPSGYLPWSSPNSTVTHGPMARVVDISLAIADDGIRKVLAPAHACWRILKAVTVQALTRRMRTGP